MSKTRVLLLFGGKSPEHEISVISARSVAAAINRDQYEILPVGITRAGEWVMDDETSPLLQQKEITAQGRVVIQINPGSKALVRLDGVALADGSFDIVFPLLHGPHGEDGCVQGLLESGGVPYVGAGVAASAVGMDKELARAVFASRGLRQVEYLTFRKHRWMSERDTLLSEIEQALSYPLFVKPANLGSSIGISKAKTRTGLADAIDAAARYDSKIMIERSVERARELECAVLGNEEPVASVVGEIIPGAEFYDYRTKYLDDRSQLIIPAKLPEDVCEQIKTMSLTAFSAVAGSGLSRVDFLMAPDGSVFLNEINTMPGFTPISMYPRLWKESGIDYPDLIARLVELGLERHARRQSASLR